MTRLLALACLIPSLALAGAVDYDEQRATVLDCAVEPLDLDIPEVDGVPVYELPVDAYGELTCLSVDADMLSGALNIETNDDYIIEALSYEAEVCLPCESNDAVFQCTRSCWQFADYARVLDYTPDGREYLVRSNLNNSIYPIRFLRRAPTEVYDPVAIMQLEFQWEDRAGQATLIYRAHDAAQPGAL